VSPRSFLWRAIAPLILVSSLLALSAPTSAHAAIGDYDVRLTATAAPHWFETGRGPFVASNMRVHSGVGTYQNADYRAWRLVVPGDGAQIVGGTIIANITTGSTLMRGRILAGAGTAPPTVLYDGSGNGQVIRAVSGTNDWIQVDLRSTGTVKATRAAEHSMSITSVALTLRDSVAPIITPLILPSPATWHGASVCAQYMLRFGDQGGGLGSAVVRRDRDGAVIASWTAPRAESTRPGPTQYDLGDCVAPDERYHGDTGFTATVTDVSGRATSFGFVVRADQVAPTITDGPGEGARLAGPTQTFDFGVSDSGSGLAALNARVDGTDTAVALAGDRARITPGRLAVGPHTVAFSAVDGAGNSSGITRRFTIADDTAPVLHLTSPDARGESTAFVDVRVSDDHSGIDKASWRISVNGEPVTIQADADQATAQIGPLAPGAQRIDIQVADVSGNVARLNHTYTVVSASAPSMPNVGAQSGIWIAEAPQGVISYGTRTAIVAYLARNGRPMTNQIVQVRRGGVPVGSTTSDADGVARVTFPVTAPGSYDAFVVGGAFDAAPLTIKVAPRIVLGAPPKLVRVGKRVVITGRMFPAIRGRRVAVEARIGGVWYPIRRAATVGADGRFRSSVIATTKGAAWVRVRVLAVGSWSAATSNERAIRAR